MASDVEIVVRAQDQASRILERVGETARKAMDKARQAAKGLSDSLRGSGTDAGQSLDKAAEAAERAGEAAQKAGADGAGGMRQLQGAADGAARGLGAIWGAAGKAGSALWSMAVGGAKAVGEMLVDAAQRGSAALTTLGVVGGASLAKVGVGVLSLKENAQVAFSTMLGSMGKAEGFMDRLYEFALTTPFAFPDLLTGAQNLIAMGLGARKVIPTLSAVGDAVAAMGGGAQKLQEITDVFAAIQTQGKVTGYELLRLHRNGIPALKILANQAGVSAMEMKAQISEGAIGAEKAIAWLSEGIKEGTDGMAGQTARMGGMMAGLKQLWTGAIDSLKSGWRTLGETIMAEPFENALKPTVTALGDMIRSVRDWLRELPAGTLERFFAPLERIPVWIEGITSAVSGGGLEKVVSLFERFGPAIGAVGAAVGAMGLRSIPFIGQFIPMVHPLLAGIAGLVALSPELRSAVAKAWETVGPTLKDLGGAFGDLLTQVLGTVIPGLAGGIKGLGEAIASGLRWLTGALPDIVDGIGRVFAEVGPSIGNLGSAIWDAVSRIARDVLPVLVKAFTELVPVVATVIDTVAETIRTLVPVVLPVIKTILGVVGSLAAAFNSLPDGIKTVAAAFVLLSSPISRAIDLIGTFVTKLVAAQTAGATGVGAKGGLAALLALPTPITLGVAAAAVGVGAIAVAYGQAQQRAKALHDEMLAGQTRLDDLEAVQATAAQGWGHKLAGAKNFLHGVPGLNVIGPGIIDFLFQSESNAASEAAAEAARATIVGIQKAFMEAGGDMNMGLSGMSVDLSAGQAAFGAGLINRMIPIETKAKIVERGVEVAAAAREAGVTIPESFWRGLNEVRGPGAVEEIFRGYDTQDLVTMMGGAARYRDLAKMLTADIGGLGPVAGGEDLATAIAQYDAIRGNLRELNLEAIETYASVGNMEGAWSILNPALDRAKKNLTELVSKQIDSKRASKEWAAALVETTELTQDQRLTVGRLIGALDHQGDSLGRAKTELLNAKIATGDFKGAVEILRDALGKPIKAKIDVDANLAKLKDIPTAMLTGGPGRVGDYKIPVSADTTQLYSQLEMARGQWDTARSYVQNNPAKVKADTTGARTQVASLLTWIASANPSIRVNVVPNDPHGLLGGGGGNGGSDDNRTPSEQSSSRAVPGGSDDSGDRSSAVGLLKITSPVVVNVPGVGQFQGFIDSEVEATLEDQRRYEKRRRRRR